MLLLQQLLPTPDRSSSYECRSVVLPAILVLLCIVGLVGEIAPGHWIRWASYPLLLIFVVATLLRREKLDLALLCVALATSAVIGVMHDDPSAIIGAAIEQACFLVAFVLLLSLPQEAAATSKAVRSVGLFLTSQPALWRFPAIFVGTGLLSVVFNLGLVALLAPVILQGHNLERGQFSEGVTADTRSDFVAMFRGFAWAVLWSPTALAPLLLLQLIPGVDRWRWAVMGAGIAMIVLVASWVSNALTSGNNATQTQPARRSAGFLHLLAVCLFYLGFAVLAMRVLDASFIVALMIAAPVVTIVWLWIQSRAQRAGAPVRFHRQIAFIIQTRLPVFGRVAYVLALAGYLGGTLAGLIPADRLMDFLYWGAFPDFIFLGGVALVIPFLAQFAISPIVIALFFGSIFGALPSLPVDPTFLALAISCGWALSIASSPFSTIVLIGAGATGLPPQVLSWKWNGAFMMAAACLCVAVFFILTGGN